MTVQITSQRKAQESARAVTWCYICGRSLNRGTPSDVDEQVSTDHVVPRAVLGDEPFSPRQSWGLTLRVHKSCENKAKSATDNFVPLLLKLHTQPPSELTPREQGALRRSVIVTPAPDGSMRHSFGNANTLRGGVWTWIRGIHSLLHREYLPATTPSYIGFPVPTIESVGVAHLDTGPHRPDQAQDTILVLVGFAWHNNECDVVKAWGYKLRFYGAWFEYGSGADRFMFAWILHHPGVPEWSRSTVGQSVPWHGAYFLPHLPANATLIPDDRNPEIVRYAAWRANRAHLRDLLQRQGQL